MKIGIRVNRPELLEIIAARLPPGARLEPLPIVDELFSFFVGSPSSRPGTRSYHLVYISGGRLGRTLDLDEALTTLEGYVGLYIAAWAHRRIFVHAGVVGWKGRALLLPGRSFAGKSSLVAELVRAGAVYYSDEFAVLDQRGRVFPYARPIHLRREGTAVRDRLSVEALGGTRGFRSIPVGLVVMTHYRQGARWRPRPLTPGQLVLALFANTVAAKHAAERALPVLKTVAVGALGLRGARGEAATVARHLLDRIERMR